MSKHLIQIILDELQVLYILPIMNNIKALLIHTWYIIERVLWVSCQLTFK